MTDDATLTTLSAVKTCGSSLLIDTHQAERLYNTLVPYVNSATPIAVSLKGAAVITSAFAAHSIGRFHSEGRAVLTTQLVKLIHANAADLDLFNRQAANADCYYQNPQDWEDMKAINHEP